MSDKETMEGLRKFMEANTRSAAAEEQRIAAAQKEKESAGDWPTIQWFAGMALSGLMANNRWDGSHEALGAARTAEHAFAAAVAMTAEIKRQKETAKGGEA